MKDNPNAQYFLWAVVLGIIAILYPLILATDIWTIVVRGFHEKSADVFAYYIVALVSLIVLPILDIICVLLLWRVSPEIFKKDFPIPYPSCSNSRHKSCGPIFIQIAAVFIFTMCLQHLSFHGSYIILGFATSPLQATSLLAFYSAAAFCVVSLIAVILKVIHIKSIKGWKIKTCVKQLVPLLMVIFFVGFVSCFIAFYIQTTVLVGEYRNSGGLTSFIGSLAPSVLLSLVGLIEKRFVDFDMTKKKTTDGVETADQSSSSVEANEDEVLENPSVELGDNGDMVRMKVKVTACTEQDRANSNELENPAVAESGDGD